MTTPTKPPTETTGEVPTPRTDQIGDPTFSGDYEGYMLDYRNLCRDLERENAALQAKLAEMEDDFSVAAETEDALRAQLEEATNEAHTCDDIKLDQPLAGIIFDLQKDRDTLRAELSAKTNEVAEALSNVAEISRSAFALGRKDALEEAAQLIIDNACNLNKSGALFPEERGELDVVRSSYAAAIRALKSTPPDKDKP